MKIRQLSIFIENKPGHLRRACRLLTDAGIDIETMALADTEQFGILRFIIKDWQRAKTIFENQGLVVRETELIAVMVEDRPGGLTDLLESIDKANLNIEYMYGYASRVAGKAVMFLRFNEPDEALKALNENNVVVVAIDEIFKSG
ncbi:MAG: hypothetical protein LBQ54_14260 [Planctomycetaceae bacterium]|jgi:hypothetical protein|nr:hypothetical protein [Planctomycetaceae bacterium]